MAISKVIKELGITSISKYSTLTTNWFRHLKRLEAASLLGTAVRIGAKRVVIAVETSQRKFRWQPLAIFVCLIALIICVYSFTLHDISPTKKIVAIELCQLPKAGDQVLLIENVLSFSNWNADSSKSQKIGNLTLFDIEATCGSKKLKASLLVSETSGLIRIKKLTPTIK